MALKGINFKETEVGLIPDDWQIFALSEIVDFLDGKRKPIKDTDRSKMQGQYPYYGASGIIDYVNDYIFNEELILLGEDGENILSRNVRLSFKVNGKIWVNNHAHVLKPKSHVDIGFLTEKLESINYEKYNSGTAQPKLNQKTCSKILIALPKSKSAQTAIATALSDTDALIESLEKLIAKKRSIKQGAMQELLTGRKRLAGFNRKWETKKVREIGEIAGSGVDKKVRLDEVPVRLVNYLDVYHRDFIYSNELYHWVTAPIAQALRCEVKEGDIFFTPSSEMRYDIAISAIAMENIPDAAYSYHIVRLRLFEDWDLRFRAYIFKTKNFIDQAETICEGSGKRYVISLSKFREMEICFPADKAEQIAISNILYDLDSELNTFERKVQKYKMIKQGMMQSLLTGKIRLL